MALPKASDNPFPSVLAVESTTPASPSSGQQRLFVDIADHKLKRVNSSGTVTTIEGGGSAATAGSSSLVFRKTVTGAAQAAIDTGVDTPDAGSNDFTNGDLLEIFMYLRTDDATLLGGVWQLRFNNDSGSNYGRENMHANNTTVTGFNSLAATAILDNCPTTAGTANYFGAATVVIPNYAGTTGYKFGTLQSGMMEALAANCSVAQTQIIYASTSAITRVAVAAFTAGKKLQIGSQLLIYKRLAS